MDENHRGGGRTSEEMRALGVRHATVESEGDLAGTMATLVENPVYEFWPVGLRMTGRAQVRRYYENLIDNFMPSQLGYEMLEETVSPTALSQEYVIRLNGPAGPESHRVTGVLFAPLEVGDLLGGERIWGSEKVLKLMVGPVWDELEPITE